MAEVVFRVSECFPKSQVYSLTSQLTRAAASVPGNIAEGNARGIAKGSLVEAETYILLARRLGYVEDDAVQPVLALMAEIGKILTAIRSKLLASPH